VKFARTTPFLSCKGSVLTARSPKGGAGRVGQISAAPGNLKNHLRERDRRVSRLKSRFSGLRVFWPELEFQFKLILGGKRRETAGQAMWTRPRRSGRHHRTGGVQFERGNQDSDRRAAVDRTSKSGRVRYPSHLRKKPATVLASASRHWKQIGTLNGQRRQCAAPGGIAGCCSDLELAGGCAQRQRGRAPPLPWRGRFRILKFRRRRWHWDAPGTD